MAQSTCQSGAIDTVNGIQVPRWTGMSLLQLHSTPGLRLRGGMLVQNSPNNFIACLCS